MTAGIFEKQEVQGQTGLEQIAALMISALHPSANEHEANNAFNAIRRKVGSGAADVHAIAERIRGHESFARGREDAPSFAAMPAGVRRFWLDAILLRLRLSDWERRFIVDVRPKALSSLGRLSLAQTRTLQQLIDRAWLAGVRP